MRHVVIGTLEAQRYALFVSHEHPNMQVQFGVFSTTRIGEPWGEFTFSSDRSPNVRDDQPLCTHRYAKKVSYCGDAPASVLLARLRFKCGEDEPTSH